MQLLEVASPKKILFHQDKVKEYLMGNFIFPATLELDITDECSRKCKDCPSARSAFNRHLDFDFIDRLFASMEGQTHGLLLTGGEPTLSPLFPQVLSMARHRGFQNIAVVTNGSFLHKESVIQAVVTHASTIRLSMYDRGPENCSELEMTLQSIQRLRQRIDHESSPAKIGVSLLTSEINASKLICEAQSVRDAGAHWIYFHPTCIRWQEGAPCQVSQKDVLETIDRYRNCVDNGLQIHVLRERYANDPIEFSRYHAAHFLMVVGADGFNYLAPELKYQPRHVLADLNKDLDEGFLWRPERTSRIAAVKSDTYPAIGSRHRGELYSHLLEKLIRGDGKIGVLNSSPPEENFMFPHIL